MPGLLRHYRRLQNFCALPPQPVETPSPCRHSPLAHRLSAHSVNSTKAQFSNLSEVSSRKSRCSMSRSRGPGVGGTSPSFSTEEGKPIETPTTSDDPGAPQAHSCPHVPLRSLNLISKHFTLELSPNATTQKNRAGAFNFPPLQWMGLFDPKCSIVVTKGSNHSTLSHYGQHIF